MAFSAHQVRLISSILFHLQSAIKHSEHTVLSSEGPLLVIVLYALQSLRFGTQRRIQSLTKHMRSNVFEKVAKGFQRLAIFTNC